MSNRHFQIVKPKDNESEHTPVCSIDGEPWPCRHNRSETHRAFVERSSILCFACGKPRKAYGSLTVEKALDGRLIYFHHRQACRPKAKEWWDANVLPHTGEAFREGQWIDDLARYIGARHKLTAT